jgi:GNAT superfamily N-acetyltransferase
MPAPELREATPADAPAIADLVTQLGYPSTEAQAARRLEQILSNPEWVTLVAEEAGQVLGFGGLQRTLSYEHDGPVAKIVALVVDQGARRQGVGEAIVRGLERRAVGMGVSRMAVNSANHRADAHAFYEKLGYARTGVRFARVLA